MNAIPALDQTTPREISEKAFSRALVASMVAGFLILAAVVGMTGWLLLRAQDFNRAVEHTYEVEATLADYRAHFERAESSRRGYLLSGNPFYLGTYAETQAGLEPALRSIRSLTVDNPAQQARVRQLEILHREKMGLIERSMAQRRAGGLAVAVEAFQTDHEQKLLEQIRVLATRMTAEERILLQQRAGRQATNGRLLLAVVTAAGALLALLAGGTSWVMHRFTRDLTRSRAALRRLNEGLEEAVAERTADLRRANEEIQRFAYIVSHDLRSPLVNIMGFTSELEAASKPLRKLVEDTAKRAPDLVSPEAAAAVELDLPESIGFIRSSTQKMDRLISAILRLSREGRRRLTPEPLAMDTLVAGVIQSMKSQADGRGAVVSVETPLPDLVSDRVAIEQVFSNLVENAIKYLKPGRPGEVTIRGREEGGRVVFEVQDNGRGVDPKDHERIFDLFRRAGRQDQPGEGIGLAHVRSLVYRLGGLIGCVSALDQGATFRLSLPRVLARDTEPS